MTPQEKAKDKRLRKLFRITLAEWNKIKEFEENHPIYVRLLGNRPCTDHVHSSGRVRGILSSDVNYAIGRLERVCKGRMVEVLEALALYFKANPATLALGYTPYGLLGEARTNKKKLKYGSSEADKEPRS